jgi:dihydroxyacetone kinase-like protein
MVDALEPAVDTLRAQVADGAPIGGALDQAAAAAEAGMRATIPIQARKGRASYLGERSVGHQDPGATSTALILRALQRAVTNKGN